MRVTRKLLAALVGAILLGTLSVLANPIPAGAADSGTEAQFVARINGIRAQKGLQPLAVYGEVRDVARNWTDQMVGNGGISHNPNLANEVSANWHKLGENVGVGGDVDSLMNAFVNSPAHYKNIVDPAYNYIGVGVSYDNSGRMFTTHDFMALDDQSAPPPPPAPAPKKKAAPAPVADSAPAPASDPAPLPEAPPPPPAPTPSADAARVHTVLTALRVLG
jgi:hypothetical protein